MLEYRLTVIQGPFNGIDMYIYNRIHCTQAQHTQIHIIYTYSYMPMHFVVNKRQTIQR